MNNYNFGRKISKADFELVAAFEVKRSFRVFWKFVSGLVDCADLFPMHAEEQLKWKYNCCTKLVFESMLWESRKHWLEKPPRNDCTVLTMYSRVLPLFGRNEFIESKSGSSRSAKTCLFFFKSNTVFSLRIIFVVFRDLSTVLTEPDFWLFVTMLLVTLLDSWSDTWRGVGHIWPQLFDRFLKPWMSSLSKSSLLLD